SAKPDVKPAAAPTKSIKKTSTVTMRTTATTCAAMAMRIPDFALPLENGVVQHPVQADACQHHPPRRRRIERAWRAAVRARFAPDCFRAACGLGLRVSRDV